MDLAPLLSLAGEKATNPTPAIPFIGEGAMDLAPLLSLAGEKATNPIPAFHLIGEGAMDLAPLLSLAGEKATHPTPALPLAGESKADSAIGSTLDPNLTLLARQGTTVHLPLVKGEAGKGLPVWAKRGAGVQICSQVCT
ncbi:hypothetical protein KAM471_13850 [Aeromonas caviae]|nr:hypothetical protein KAM471_13850 [Aeromonas caviae]